MYQQRPFRLRRRFASSLVSLLCAGIVVLSSPAAPARAQGAPPTATPRPPSPCTVNATLGAAPQRLALGYASKLTVDLLAACPAQAAAPVHIVLVIDASGSMSGERIRQTQLALKDFVRGLRLADHPDTRVGVVTFSSVANTLCKLTNEAGRVIACLGHFTANGGTAIDRGLVEGQKVLTAGRAAVVSPARIREFMVLVSDADASIPCVYADAAAANLRSQGIIVLTVALGADAVCLGGLALGPAWSYHTKDDLARLQGLFGGITTAFADPQRPMLAIRLKSGGRLRYHASPVDPAAQSSGDDGWTWLLPSGAAPSRITLWAEPLVLGLVPAAEVAEGQLLDAAGGILNFGMAIPSIEAMDATGLPSATPLPSATAIASRTGRPTRTPVVTATPAPQVCPGLAARVPAAVIADALAQPATVYGWTLPCRSNGFDLARRNLGLSDPGKAWHPLFNGLAFKCGCP
jgi:Mg-chelatase subunit ChlD